MKKRNLSAKKKIHNFYLKNLNNPKIKKIYSQFKKSLDNQNTKSLGIAISGGPDSLALAFLAKCYSIQKNKKPEVSLKDGLMSVAIGEAAENSIKENRVVFMEEFKL